MLTHIELLLKSPANCPASAAAFNAFNMFATLWTSPLAIVIGLSFVVGLLMVVLFGYTSDQKAIGIAKDQLKAHLLAVRLYRDQIPVVMGSYGKILRGTGRYLKLAFKPLLYVIIPITFLIVQVDRYLGLAPIAANTPFLLTVRLARSANAQSAQGGSLNEDANDGMNEGTIELPQEIAMTAPPVHVPAENEIVWRLVGSKEGKYNVKVHADNATAEKNISIGSGLPQISPVRLRDHFWERIFTSAEPALPGNSAIESIAINYRDRNIDIAGYGMNWIWLFFILSMAAGFIFKELLGIKI